MGTEIDASDDVRIVAHKHFTHPDQFKRFAVRTPTYRFKRLPRPRIRRKMAPEISGAVRVPMANPAASHGVSSRCEKYFAELNRW